MVKFGLGPVKVGRPVALEERIHWRVFVGVDILKMVVF